jgi:hypothetical protein
MLAVYCCVRQRHKLIVESKDPELERHKSIVESKDSELEQEIYIKRKKQRMIK